MICLLIWRNNRVDTTFVEVTMGKSSVHLVKKCSGKDKKSDAYKVSGKDKKSDAYKVKQVYQVHATDKSLKKIIYGKLNVDIYCTNYVP